MWSKVRCCLDQLPFHLQVNDVTEPNKVISERVMFQICTSHDAKLITVTIYINRRGYIDQSDYIFSSHCCAELLTSQESRKNSKAVI